ncbi:hypothetical protein HDU91_003621 [Kappamyces sp. JEL0680]|nr:hypothetical protein HDU91_003621 [Kappamyces sp. JEL0680]
MDQSAFTSTLSRPSATAMAISGPDTKSTTMVITVVGGLFAGIIVLGALFLLYRFRTRLRISKRGDKVAPNTETHWNQLVS